MTLRLLLSWLLIGTLVFQGASSAWAMGEMHAGGHSGTASADPHAGHGVDPMHGHGHHSMADTPVGDGQVPPTADHDCCDGGSCPCGCILPMVLLRSGLLPPPCIAPGAPSVRSGADPGLARTTPPFRPPTA